MTDVRLEDCAAPDDGWDGWDDWDTGLRRSVDRAEAVERAASSRIFFVRAVARALLAVDAGLLPTRRRARRAGRGLLRLVTILAAPVILPGRALARFVSSTPEVAVPEVAVPEVAPPGAVVPEPVVPEAARRQPGRVSRQTVETLPPAPSARPARRSDGPRPAPALLA